MPRHSLTAWRIALVCLASGCASARMNYSDTSGPRYASGEAGMVPLVAPPALRVVTFNVEYAIAIDSAIALMKHDSALRGADVMLLQEMDESGARRIAEALGMQYVYYPATVHPAINRDFGNAILSRWPIVEDEKIVLPYQGWWRRTQRAAVAATLQVGGQRIRVYDVHFAMVTEQTPGHRRAQAERVIADSRRGWDRIIVGGDLNDAGLGELFADSGFAWPTQHEIPTRNDWRFDHIFLKGFDLAGSSAGVVSDVRGASDHKAVWAIVPLATPQHLAEAR